MLLLVMVFVMMKQILLNVVMMVWIAVDPMLILTIALNVHVMVKKIFISITVAIVLFNGRTGLSRVKKIKFELDGHTDRF